MEDTTPGGRVQSVRKRRGLTQRELARASGLSLATIRAIEQDTGTHPRVATLHAIAGALKVTTSDLMTPGRPEPDPVGADAWDDVRDALYRPGTAHGEDVTEAGVLRALDACLPDLADNRYGRVRAVLPGLIRESASLGGDGRTARSRVLNTTAWILTQTRQWDDALTAARLAREAAPDRLDAAAAVSTTCWCLLRQGRLGEAGTLAAQWADDLEPRFSSATIPELAAWGKILLYVNNAAVRDNQPDTAEDALSLARAAAGRIGREVQTDASTTRTFGPASVAMIAGETAAITGRPDRVLAIAAQLPRTGLLHAQSASRRRHLLDVASAHAMTRDYGEAVTVMDCLRREAPEWLAQQRYARDILTGIIERRRRLTDTMRVLADAVRLPL